jgi:hypothetical protein
VSDKRKPGRPPRKDNKCYVGHEMTPENTYTYPNGRTSCRTCARALWNSYYRRRQSVKEKQ